MPLGGAGRGGARSGARCTHWHLRWGSGAAQRSVRQDAAGSPIDVTVVVATREARFSTLAPVRALLPALEQRLCDSTAHSARWQWQAPGSCGTVRGSTWATKGGPEGPNGKWPKAPGRTALAIARPLSTLTQSRSGQRHDPEKPVGAWALRRAGHLRVRLGVKFRGPSSLVQGRRRRGAPWRKDPGLLAGVAPARSYARRPGA